MKHPLIFFEAFTYEDEETNTDQKKYLQTTYLTKDQYLEYIVNSQNETEKNSPIRNGKIHEETCHQRRCADDKSMKKHLTLGAYRKM